MLIAPLLCLQLLCEQYKTEISCAEDVANDYELLSGLLTTTYNSKTTSEVLKQVMVAHGDSMQQLTKIAAAIAVIPVSTAGDIQSFLYKSCM
jgi:hypothetical protein